MNPVEKILRPALGDLAPYNSGLSLAEVKAKYNVTTIAKLGSNENPFGPAPEVLELLSQGRPDIFLYPESNGGVLRDELSRYLDVNEDCLVFGNGSEELLSIICRSVVEPGDRVITLFPSFPLHEDYPAMMGGILDRVTVDGDLKIDVEALLNAVRKPAKMLVFANPMNPVGAWLAPSELQEVLAATHPDTLIVLDEAYYEYAHGGDYQSGLDIFNPDSGNWVVLRTFSKAWGLAGLRIGFGVCSSSALRSAFDLTRTPFNINSIAQSAALAAIKHDGHMQHHVARIKVYRGEVMSKLSQMGLKCADSLGNFVFFDAGANSVTIAEHLLVKGTIVKPWKQRGFDTFIRASVGTEQENQKFLSDMASVLP